MTDLFVFYFILNSLLSAKQKSETEVKEEPGESKELTRTLKGVMRVGVLAKVSVDKNLNEAKTGYSF